MTEGEKTRIHVFVKGRVQGVGFRAFVMDKANSLNLKGWVRNRWDGSVEVIAEGERPALEKLLPALHQGPRMANVSTVQVEWEEATGEYTHFYSRSTI
jgi:acylphosphatase